MTYRRMLIITPVYEDAENLAITARAMERQLRRPDRWIIVDDGSRDETPRVAAEICSRLPFATLVRVSPQDKRDGLATASEAAAFNIGLRHAGPRQWDLIGKFDSDLDFPADYLMRLEAALARDPSLGIVGGHLREVRAGRLVDVDRVPDDHVRGATKLYRATTFAQIGGIVESLGWDTVDEIRAQMRGWDTRSLHGLGIVHLRPRASRGGQLRGARRLGTCAHALGYDPLFTLARTLWIAPRPPALRGAGAYLLGWLTAALAGRPRVVTQGELRWLRRRQRRRLGAAIGQVATASVRTGSTQPATARVRSRRAPHHGQAWQPREHDAPQAAPAR